MQKKQPRRIKKDASQQIYFNEDVTFYSQIHDDIVIRPIPNNNTVEQISRARNEGKGVIGQLWQSRDRDDMYGLCSKMYRFRDMTRWDLENSISEKIPGVVFFSILYNRLIFTKYAPEVEIRHPRKIRREGFLVQNIYTKNKTLRFKEVHFRREINTEWTSSL